MGGIRGGAVALALGTFLSLHLLLRTALTLDLVSSENMPVEARGLFSGILQQGCVSFPSCLFDLVGFLAVRNRIVGFPIVQNHLLIARYLPMVTPSVTSSPASSTSPPSPPTLTGVRPFFLVPPSVLR
jgi:hypothetical protein